MTEEIRKGLVGVVADSTAISKVNPETNSLLYRGYPVQDLASQKSFEEVALLLWNGELPSQAELDDFIKLERANRALAPEVKAAIDLLPKDAHPMDVSRTAVSVIGARHDDAENSDASVELRKAKELFAAFPAVVAYDQRRRRGLDVVEPRDDLDYSQNFLWMTSAKNTHQKSWMPSGCHGALRGALLQRLDLYRPGHHLNRGRPALRGHRCHWCAEGPTARRCK